MLSTILITLAIATSALSEETANLRGAKPIEHSHVFANQKNNMKKQEAALNALLKNKPDAHMAPEEGAAKTTENGPRTLDNYNGGNPELTFYGYMISRYHVNGDCSGAVESTIARSLGCHYTGGNYSTFTSCDTVHYGGGSRRLAENSKVELKSNNNDYKEPRYFRQYFYGNKCQGDPYSWGYENFSPCDGNGMAMQCFQKETTPDFAKKDGLVTYKFRNVDDCIWFAYNSLNYWPYTVDDDDQFEPIDDDYNSRDDDADDNYDDGYDDEGGEGNNDGGGMVGRRLMSDAASVPETPAGATAAAAVGGARIAPRSARHAGTRHALKRASTRPEAAPQDAAATLAGQDGKVHKDGNKQEEEVETEFWNGTWREYELQQLRNNVCTYDEKYGLYVKTACHGRTNQISYFLFMDAKCTKAIKKTVHNIYEEVPKYGMCVPSGTSSRDKRATLTVCHNDGGNGGGNLPAP